MHKRIAGIDEVGRGPLVGPVVAAAVILDPGHPIDGLKDSKKLSEKKREALFIEITNKALAYGIAECSAEEIDQINILQASLLAMKRAYEQLTMPAELILIDGNRCPNIDGVPMQAIIKGDSKIEEIMAASILAKVFRDRIVADYDQDYPGYNFAKHKGYGTKEHLAAIEELGLTPMHRRSFGPCKLVSSEW